MRTVEYEDLVWVDDRYERRTFYRVVADQSESDKLKRACENIGVSHCNDYYSDYTDLTPSGLEKLQKALENPKPTRQEIQDARVWDKFLNVIASSQAEE